MGRTRTGHKNEMIERDEQEQDDRMDEQERDDQTRYKNEINKNRTRK